MRLILNQFYFPDLITLKFAAVCGLEQVVLKPRKVLPLCGLNSETLVLVKETNITHTQR